MAIGEGVAHRVVEAVDGRCVRLDGRDLVHFGSCSYLGLERDPRLIEGATSALSRFGSYLSCSRVYLSLPLYRELEERLEAIFEAPVVIAPTTTLAHLAALPVLVEHDDAVVVDIQVHQSVQMAAGLLRGSGVRVEVLPHNDLKRLERRVAALAELHRRVWYLADGVYSMHANLAPVADLYQLQAAHPQLHLYLDDAHGMSWHGPRGCGWVRSHGPLTERTVVAVSLAKAFGSCGGVLVLPSSEARRRVRVRGGPLVFSGPIAPASLGASVASADLHLSPELDELQARLQARIAHADRLLRAAGLPVAAHTPVPIRFVEVGPTEDAIRLVARLMDDGFFVNAAVFPAVRARRAGVRFTLTLHHTDEDVVGLVASLARHAAVGATDAA